MTFQGWNYGHLLPIAVALLVCLYGWGQFAPRAGAAFAIGASAWLAGTSISLAMLGWAFTDIVWRRDLALAIGSALATLVPFAVAGLAYYAAPIIRLAGRPRVAVAFACGVSTLVVLPPLMFGAAVISCVLSGYISCM